MHNAKHIAEYRAAKQNQEASMWEHFCQPSDVGQHCPGIVQQIKNPKSEEP